MAWQSGVAGPLHHHLRRDAAGKSKADKGAVAGMGTDEVALGERLLTRSPLR